MAPRRRRDVLFVVVEAWLALVRRVVSGRRGGDPQVSDPRMSPRGDQWRQTMRATTLDALLLGAVMLVGVLIALAMTLF